VPPLLPPAGLDLALQNMVCLYPCFFMLLKTPL
jgi:hypothetical protein